MMTLISKSKKLKAYNLTCAIPKVGAKAKKVEKKGYLCIESERVLTMLPGQKRFNLPDAVMDSPEIISAIARGELLSKAVKVKVGAKPIAAPKKVKIAKAK